MKNLVNQLVNAGIEESEAKKEISILQKEILDENQIKEIVSERIKTRKPIQYILGKAYFMDFVVAVSEKVLIPRPETEILVEQTVKRLYRTDCHPEGAEQPKDLITLGDCFVGANAPPRNDKLTALDIGTGSGIIAIALAKLIPNIKIIAIDIENDIIDLAYENARKNDVESKIDFKKCDLFSDCIYGIFKTNKIDLIISNPPYICKGGVISPQQPEIAHEPNIALYGSKENKSGLVYYERIFELVKRYSRHCEERSDEAISLRDALGDCFVGSKEPPRNDVKLLALEINPYLACDLKKLLKNKGLNNFEIVKDYGKLDRCLFVNL